jgi:uncharacterized membrane protein YsdA (DUF1294 family)
MKLFLIFYAVIVSITSVITFACYGWDKRQAIHDRRRIPESKLHWLAALGGWPGALAGRQFFRHKTRKTGFTLLTGMIALIHIVILAGIAVWWLQWSTSATT